MSRRDLWELGGEIPRATRQESYWVGVDLRHDTLLTEVDRLTGELVRHLDYEEEQLIPVLGGATGAAEGR